MYSCRDDGKRCGARLEQMRHGELPTMIACRPCFRPSTPASASGCPHPRSQAAFALRFCLMGDR